MNTADSREMTPAALDAADVCMPLSGHDLLEAFELSYASAKHLLILYSLVIGMRAKVIADFGLGLTTGAIRGAARVTGGVVYTCDADKRRFEPLLEKRDPTWHLHLEMSTSFIPKLPSPIDFVMHDGAHDYDAVRSDLEMLLPKMRRFGVICVHDTQQPDLFRDMLGAIRDATAHFRVSVTNLPFASGLAIIRVEESAHPSIEPESSMLPDGRPDTLLTTFPWICSPDQAGAQLSSRSIATRLTSARIRLSHLLRQSGWRG